MNVKTKGFTSQALAVEAQRQLATQAITTVVATLAPFSNSQRATIAAAAIKLLRVTDPVTPMSDADALAAVQHETFDDDEEDEY